MIAAMSFAAPATSVKSTPRVIRPASGSGAYLLAYNFRSTPDASSPAGTLLKVGAYFYGTGAGGGVRGDGTVFRLHHSGGVYREAVLYSFAGQADGAYPAGGVVADSSGSLYGTAQYGGVASHGTVFKLTPNGAGTYFEATIDAFNLSGDGSVPSGLTMDANGVLYGTTQSGGSHGYGIVFRLAPSGSTYVETILYNFAGGDDGKEPAASVILDSTGAIYGTTFGGGKYGAGTVFKLTPSGSGYTYSTIYTLQGTYDGSAPAAALIADKNGTLYGTTYYGGGPAYLGAVFALRPKARGYTERVIYSFAGGLDGANPATSLTPGPNGIFYGTTVNGGYYGEGVIYALTPSGNGQYVESVLHTFQGYPSDGQASATPLLEESNVLYGLTSGGGVCGCGTFFDLSP